MARSSLVWHTGRKLLAVLPSPVSDALKGIKRSIRNRRSPESVFRQIYVLNSWDGTESVSGPGSTMAATANIRAALPDVISDLGIKSLLDIPCGDAHWIADCIPDDVAYTGGDIVPDLIAANAVERAALGEFILCDLVRDDLPHVDLIFVRDCFIHLPNNLIQDALKNIKRSRIRYLLTTTYTDVESNIDVDIGEYRPIDLTLAPFFLPAPGRLYPESNAAAQSGKSMGLWRNEDL